MKKNSWGVLLAGGLFGAAAILLVALGNPPNMGVCVACFVRDIAGALGLHGADKFQYVRPEIAGLVVGAFVMSLASREFRAKSGASPATRFLLGGIMGVGALAFLGCPLRMVLRLAAGDANAMVGLLGFTLGIWIGVQFLKKGFSLKRAYDASAVEGALMPVGLLVLMGLFVAVPTVFRSSEAGPGSMAAPVLASFGIALILGAAAQRSRLCMAGGIRDGMLFRDFQLLYGFIALFVVALIGNLVTGNFQFGFVLQPAAHSSHLWNLLGMVLVGWAAVLLGGCPLRQLILTGSGNADSAVTLLGMLLGAGLAHNFGWAGMADSINEAGKVVIGGLSTAGKIAVISCLVILTVVSVLNLPKKAKK